jgi:hypothetical protein
MSWFATVVIALLTGVCGLFCAGAVASCCVRWFRISGFEGKSGYFVIGVALLGGIASLIAGIVISRVVAGWPDPGFFKALGCALGAVLILSGLSLLLCRWRAHIPPVLDGRELMLEVEVRLPDDDAAPPAEREGAASLTLGAVTRHVRRASQSGEVFPARSRMEHGRWIVPASVFLFTRRGLRCLDMQLGGKSVAGFIIPLPPRPGRRHEQWSDWSPRGMPGQPWPESKPSWRFRVVRIEPESGGAPS